MNWDFGIEFIDNKGNGIKYHERAGWLYEPIGGLASLLDGYAQAYPSLTRFYVSPDSYDIFKPTVGDMVYWSVDGYSLMDDIHTIPSSSTWHGKPCNIMPPPIKVPSHSGGFCIYPIVRTDTTCGETEIRIIQRNNTAFYMPETKE